jgi:serine O-acetyltransferase
MRFYRIGNFFYKLKVPFIPLICNFIIRIVFNSAVFSQTSIGSGTRFAYGGIGVVIHKRAVIGTNCMIGTNVTIGGRSQSKDVPVIGNNVIVSTGAKVLGGIKIGNNCVIGANAVVIKDVPDNCVAAGVPAKVIKDNIDLKDYC